MLVLDRAKSFINSLRGKSVSTIIDLVNRCEGHEFRSFEDYLRAGTRKVWPTFKALDVTAQAVQTTPFGLFRQGAKEPQPAKVPELEKLFAYPNPDETFQDLLYRSTFWIKLCGIAFWFNSEATVSGDRPKEIFGLNPKRMRPALDRDKKLIGWLYRVNGKEIPFDKEEIMVFKRPHPDNEHWGLGDYEAGEALINEWLNRQDYSKQFWKNGAAPSALATREDDANGASPTQEQWESIKARFHDQYGGKKNAGKVAFLTGKWKFERIGLSSEEMEDLAKHNRTIEEIFQLHGVPLSVAGIQSAANYATAYIEDRQFRLNTVFPIVRIFQDTLNTDLVKGWGENLFLRFDVAGLVDVQKVVTDFGPLFDRGCITPNELREKVGLQPVDNPIMDQFFIQGSYVPSDLAGLSANGGAADQQAQRMIADFSRKLLLQPQTTNQQQ